MIVVDASVAVKWLVKEAGAASAVELLSKEDQLVAPTLIQVEVAGAVARKTSRGDIEQDEAERAFSLWRRLLSSHKVQLDPDNLDLDTAFALSIELSHQIQDCLYLAVANRRRVDLVTADQRFVDKLAGRHSNVRLFAS